MLTKTHSRSFRTMKYVYPVISRRSGGVSLGINICKQCNFSCIYCQVLGDTPDSVRKSAMEPVSKSELYQELKELIFLVRSGELFQDDWFKKAPPEKRRLNDLAFSGDGEPTLSSDFPEMLDIAIDVRRDFCKEETKIVLISNATMFHVKYVQNALERLMQNNGEIWAKLDAGTESLYNTVSRSKVPFAKILENITETAKRFPVTIQTLFLSNYGSVPDEMEIDQYIQRLREIIENGGRIEKIQIYTTARNTPDANVLSLEDAVVKQIVKKVHCKTHIPTFPYFSS